MYNYIFIANIQLLFQTEKKDRSFILIDPTYKKETIGILINNVYLTTLYFF